MVQSLLVIALWSGFCVAMLAAGFTPRLVRKYNSRKGSLYGAALAFGIASLFFLVIGLWRVIF